MPPTKVSVPIPPPVAPPDDPPYKGLATGYVVDTMQTVFHCFFTSRSFEACLIDTVNQGGDADTTGAIAGALAGAYFGEESIPPRWLKKLDRKLVAEIRELSDGLIRLSPAFNQAPFRMELLQQDAEEEDLCQRELHLQT